jgi:glycosyltransferase involved in cell wall biosynthesis
MGRDREVSGGDTGYIIDEPSPDPGFNVIDFNHLPLVSFCIPTLNNESTLDECLDSIRLQDYPRIELVIVDGGSGDRTVEIAKKYTDKIYLDRGPLGSARQTGIDRSCGEILALFDADIIIPHKKWLLNAIKYFNHGGHVSTVWPKNVAPPGAPWSTRLYFNYWRVVCEDSVKRKRGIFGGGNALFLARHFREIGGIDRSIHWGEDYDWAVKLKKKGYSVVYLRDPLYHNTMRSLGEYTKKQFIGAKTFTSSGPELMQLTFADVIYEQVFLGVKGMIKGIIFERDPTWLLFPLFLIIKGYAYLSTYAKKFLARHKIAFWCLYGSR